MTYTRHGHHIPGTTDSDENGQTARARCGGVAICTQCQKDATQHIMRNSAVPGDPHTNLFEQSSDKTERILHRARICAIGSYNNREDDNAPVLATEDLDVLHYVYVTGFWEVILQAKVSRNVQIFRVTHNEAQEKTVVNTYTELYSDVFTPDGGTGDL